jgi:hypothetical protein
LFRLPAERFIAGISGRAAGKWRWGGVSIHGNCWGRKQVETVNARVDDLQPGAARSPIIFSSFSSRLIGDFDGT